MLQRTQNIVFTGTQINISCLLGFSLEPEHVTQCLHAHRLVVRFGARRLGQIILQKDSVFARVLSHETTQTINQSATHGRVTVKPSETVFTLDRRIEPKRRRRVLNIKIDGTATGFSQQLRQGQRRQFSRHEYVKRIEIFLSFAHALEPLLGDFQKRICRGPQLGAVDFGAGTKFQPERLLPGKVRVLR